MKPRDSLCKEERDHVAKVHTPTAGTSARIQEERLLLFEFRKDTVQLSTPRNVCQNATSRGSQATGTKEGTAPVAEKHPPPQQKMRLVTRDLLESIEQLLIYEFRSELLDELVVIDRHLPGGKGPERKEHLDCKGRERMQYVVDGRAAE